MKLLPFVPGAALAAITLLPHPALARGEFCNVNAGQIKAIFAIAQPGGGYSVRGIGTVKPARCRTLFAGDASMGTVYVADWPAGEALPPARGTGGSLELCLNKDALMQQNFGVDNLQGGGRCLSDEIPVAFAAAAVGKVGDWAIVANGSGIRVGTFGRR